jgi:hypothetical protein
VAGVGDVDGHAGMGKRERLLLRARRVHC